MPPPLDADGLRLEVRQLRDQIARLRADEATYRDIVNRTNSAVLRSAPEGRVIFLNDYGQSFFGYTSDELVGHSVLGLIVPDAESSGRDLNAMIHDLLRHPERYLSNENENVRRDGDRVWITWRNTPIADAEFVVVLPGVPRLGAVEKAREIRARIREMAYLAGTGQPVRLAASFGVATYPDDARDLESLLAMGDQALFAVKRSGRDGIIAAGARDPAGT